MRMSMPARMSTYLTPVQALAGHYSGRTHHIHILGSYNGTVASNSTYIGSTVASIGQLFFDQNLNNAVEQLRPYSTNTQSVTTNAEDSIFAQAAANSFDPVMEYALLGDTLADGVFAWISIGVDMTVSDSVSAAATLTADGGVENANSGMGGGPGGGMERRVGGLGAGGPMGGPIDGGSVAGGPAMASLGLTPNGASLPSAWDGSAPAPTSSVQQAASSAATLQCQVAAPMLMLAMAVMFAVL